MIWRCSDRTFDLDRGPLVMGILNVTPDSFSDGGRFATPTAAIARAREMAAEGASIIDVGAESTRPGAAPVPVEEQWQRLAPVLPALSEVSIPISIDTSNAEVAARALDAGAAVVNDVTALRDPAMAGLVAARGAGLVLMHMRGSPATMQDHVHYDDVTAEVREDLAAALGRARSAGVDDDAVVLDPGIGFGKTVEHSLEILARIEEFGALGRPLLIGASRKSMIGRVLDLPVPERLEGGLAIAAIAVRAGVRIVRTHDVRATVRVVRMAEAIRGAHRSGAPPERPPEPASGAT